MFKGGYFPDMPTAVDLCVGVDLYRFLYLMINISIRLYAPICQTQQHSNQIETVFRNHQNCVITIQVSKQTKLIHSWLINGFLTRLTRRVPLVEQELLALPEHLSSFRFQWGSCSSVFSVMCMFYITLFVLFLFPLCSVLLFTDSGYPFGIFKLFLRKMLMRSNKERQTMQWPNSKRTKGQAMIYKTYTEI